MEANSAPDINPEVGTVPLDNFALVEGPWKDYSLKRVEPQDYPRVVRHVQDYFIKDEPTCGLLGYTTDFLDEMEALVRTMLGDNLSFLAEHEETGEVSLTDLLSLLEKLLLQEKVSCPEKFLQRFDTQSIILGLSFILTNQQVAGVRMRNL